MQILFSFQAQDEILVRGLGRQEARLDGAGRAEGEETEEDDDDDEEDELIEEDDSFYNFE
jgi:hypothetical protein